MAKLDGFESYDDAGTVKRLLGGMEFNEGRTIVCAIYNEEEEAGEHANRRRSKEMVRGFQRFSQQRMRFCSNRCIHEKGQQRLEIFETLKDRLIQK